MKFPVLNADLGECEPPAVSEALIRRLGAANIACGGHAGSTASIRNCLQLCRKYGTLAGAHPGLPDAFGRGAMLPSAAAFRQLLDAQWRRIATIAREEGVRLHHIKLHGSLYTAVEGNAELREVFLDFLSARADPPVVFALAAGCLPDLAAPRQLRVWREAFADRSYEADGSLTPRSQPMAVLQSPMEIQNRIQNWLRNGTIPARCGQPIPLQADTLCIHSDSPHVLETVERLCQLFRMGPDDELTHAACPR